MRSICFVRLIYGPPLQCAGGFGNADGPLWSLFIEGQIYLIAGGTAMIVWSRRLPVALAGAVAIYIGVTRARNEHFPLYAAIWLGGSALRSLRSGERCLHRQRS